MGKILWLLLDGKSPFPLRLGGLEIVNKVPQDTAVFHS